MKKCSPETFFCMFFKFIFISVHADLLKLMPKCKPFGTTVEYLSHTYFILGNEDICVWPCHLFYNTFYNFIPSKMGYQ